MKEGIRVQNLNAGPSPGCRSLGQVCSLHFLVRSQLCASPEGDLSLRSTPLAQTRLVFSRIPHDSNSIFSTSVYKLFMGQISEYSSQNDLGSQSNHYRESYLPLEVYSTDSAGVF